jgi:Leucine-rich repeat (LRR) protein
MTCSQHLIRLNDEGSPRHNETLESSRSSHAIVGPSSAPLRSDIHELRTNADPAGTIRELILARNLIRQLEAALRERDDNLHKRPASGSGSRDFRAAPNASAKQNATAPRIEWPCAPSMTIHSPSG